MIAPDIRPPCILAFFLAKLLSGAVRDGAVDDFSDKFERISLERNRGVALAWYIGQIAYLIPVALKDSLYWSAVMIQNYAVVALRNVRKHKAYSLINVAGLAIGIAMLTISTHCIRAAASNPADSLRYE